MNDHSPPVPYGVSGFDDEDSNRSGNPHFDEVLRRRLSRRQLLAGGLGLAVAGGAFASPALARVADIAAPKLAKSPVANAVGQALGFTAVPVGRADTITVPAGYVAEAILPWGEPVTGSFPAYLDGGLNTGADQEQQMGMHHDGMHFFPIGGARRNDASSHGLLVMNHEYIDQNAMHPDGPVTVGGVRDADQVRKEIAAHGVSVVEIRRRNDSWLTLRGRYNRRITGATPMTTSGAARGHAKMRTVHSPAGTDTRGTLNNCSHGYTPWGTYLTCEENWAGYFVNRGTQPREQSRYGVPSTGGRYGWETVEPRFDATPGGADALADYRNEPNLFGWIVEIDPWDATSRPVKHTALGRFGHEGIVFAQPQPGKPVVAYMGDDATNEYIYRFVSRRAYFPDAASNRTLLEEGVLSVAVFNDDGSGEWRPLDIRDAAFRAAADKAGVVFEDQGDVLINTRLAADVVGATRMDRPEWGAIDPRTGMAYFTLTNNGGRQPGDTDEPNPRGPNPYGHIIRFLDRPGRVTQRAFTWDLFLLSGTTADSIAPDGGSLTDENIHASPDGIWFDDGGLLWIQTDMSGSQLTAGPFGNNQMLCADPETGELKRFLVGPVGCEVTGVVTTPDRRTMFVNIQHPGEPPPSDWPDGNGARPRSSTVVVRRVDGGIVGT